MHRRFNEGENSVSQVGEMVRSINNTILSII